MSIFRKATGHRKLNKVYIWEHRLMLLFVCKKQGEILSERREMQVLRKGVNERRTA